MNQARDKTPGWDIFCDRLGALLATLADGGGDQEHLFLGLPVQDPALALAQRDDYSGRRQAPQDGRRRSRRARPGAADATGELTRIVVDPFKTVYGIPFPGLLAYASNGSSADAAAVLGLTRLD